MVRAEGILARAPLLFTLLWLTLPSLPAQAHEGYALQIAALDAQIQAAPEDSSLLLSRAELHRHEGHLELAALDLTNAILEASDRPALYLERARLWEELEDFERVSEDLDTYVELGGGAPARWSLQARASLVRGDLDAARSAYDAAIAAAPDVDTVLARGRLDEARADYPAAIAGYAQGLALLGGAEVVRAALVRACLLGRDFVRAEELLTRAIEAAPERTELRLDRAEVRAAAGKASEARADREQALRDIEQALAHRPTDLRWLQKARALTALGEREQARLIEQQVAARSPALSGAGT